MKGTILKGVALVAVVFATHIAAAKGLCDWPQTSVRVGIEGKRGITKATFMKVVARAEAAFAPLMESKLGCKLVVHPSWEDETINAQAWQEDNGQGPECHVEMFGGLARYPGMTPNAFAQVFAHEAGHHLGGVPYYRGETLSVEGQADYFSTDTGMPAMRLASLASSRVLADTLGELSGEPKTSLPGPALPEVKKTYEDHPAAQCRRVTFAAGRVHADRPRCWYKPS